MLPNAADQDRSTPRRTRKEELLRLLMRARLIGAATWEAVATVSNFFFHPRRPSGVGDQGRKINMSWYNYAVCSKAKSLSNTRWYRRCVVAWSCSAFEYDRCTFLFTVVGARFLPILVDCSDAFHWASQFIDPFFVA